jgi:hypothetical protein
MLISFKCSECKKKYNKIFKDWDFKEIRYQYFNDIYNKAIYKNYCECGNYIEIEITRRKSIFEIIENIEPEREIFISISGVILVSSNKILIELSKSKSLLESGYLVRRDGPHFPGDVPHAHCELSGGYEVAYDTLGRKRHPNKFPHSVPKGVKIEIAKKLKIDINKLQEFIIFNKNGEFTYLLQENNT